MPMLLLFLPLHTPAWPHPMSTTYLVIEGRHGRPHTRCAGRRAQDDSGLSEAIAAASVRDAPLRLSAQALAAARGALGPGPEGQVLVTHLHSGIDMTRKLIRCLCPAEWLNDEVMNLYMGLLQVRSRAPGHTLL